VVCCAVLCCGVLCCAVLWCDVLCCAVLYCTVLYCTVLYCTVLFCTVLYCTVLCRTCVKCKYEYNRTVNISTKCCSYKYSRVSFCDGSFYDDSLLRLLSSRSQHSRIVVHHCRSPSVLSLLSALLALSRCPCVSSFSILAHLF